MLMTKQLRALIQARVPAVLLLWFYVYPIIVLFKKTISKIYAFIRKLTQSITAPKDALAVRIYQKLYELVAPILQFLNMITETNFSGRLFLIIVSMFTVFFALEKIDLSRPTFLIWFAPILVFLWFLVVVAMLLSILTVAVRMLQNINLENKFWGKVLFMSGFILLWGSITFLASKKTFPPLVFEILNIIFIVVFLLIFVYKAIEERRERENLRFETHPKLEWKDAFEGVIDYTFPKMNSKSLVQAFGLVNETKQAAYIPLLDFVGVAILATMFSFFTFWYTDKMMPPMDEAEAKEIRRERARSTLRLVAVIIVGLTFGILLYFQILDAVFPKDG